MHHCGGTVAFQPSCAEGMVAQKQQLENEHGQGKQICLAGEGLVDWKALKEVADKHGCQAYIVEREYTPGEGSRLDVLKADLEYYRTQI